MLDNDHDEGGCSTLAPPGHTVMDITSGVVPQGESWDFVMLYYDLQGAILRQSYNQCKYVRMWDEFEHGEVDEERA